MDANTTSVIEVVRVRAINTSTLNAIVSSNDIADASGTHLEFDASTGTGAAAGGTINLDIFSNTLPASGVGVIKLNENTSGTINVKQSLANVSALNSNATVTVGGSPQYTTGSPGTPTLPTLP